MKSRRRSVASSKGNNSLLLIFKQIYECRWTCSLGFTFCTRHFVSSSSVKRKLKTIPEGHHLEKSFFLDSSWFLFTNINIDEIPLTVIDSLCLNQIDTVNWKRFKSPLHSFFNQILNFKSWVVDGLISKSCVRARLRMRSPKFQRHFRGA